MARHPVALLDVNVLVALFFADHVHHDFAHDWFEDHHRHGWATCPITANGFVRVACRQTVDGDPVRPAMAVDLLRRFTADKRHEWWPDAVSLLDTGQFSPAHIRGHAQITDVYLLGLAVARGGCLATFDRSIPLDAVPNARPSHLTVIGGA